MQPNFSKIAKYFTLNVEITIFELYLYFLEVVSKSVMCFDRQSSAIRKKKGLGWCMVKPPNNQNIFSKKL